VHIGFRIELHGSETYANVRGDGSFARKNMVEVVVYAHGAHSDRRLEVYEPAGYVFLVLYLAKKGAYIHTECIADGASHGEVVSPIELAVLGCSPEVAHIAKVRDDSASQLKGRSGFSAVGDAYSMISLSRYCACD
jgi:hypothetical protein